MRRVAIVQTGVANTASVVAAMRRCGAEPTVTDDTGAIAGATHVVLPGVGAFGAGMACLRATGLDRVLSERIAQGRPTLAVCLGLQLLCRSSEESPGVTGLGVLACDVGEFAPTVRVPQFGWNRVQGGAPGGVIETGYAYFANSFRIASAPPEWTPSTAEHGGRFVAALERGAVVGCQFHPELSGAWGLALVRRWLAMEGATPC